MTGGRRKSRVSRPKGINRLSGTTPSENEGHGHTAPNQKKMAIFSNVSIAGVTDE